MRTSNSKLPPPDLTWAGRTFAKTYGFSNQKRSEWKRAPPLSPPAFIPEASNTSRSTPRDRSVMSRQFIALLPNYGALRRSYAHRPLILAVVMTRFFADVSHNVGCFSEFLLPTVFRHRQTCRMVPSLLIKFLINPDSFCAMD